MLYEYAPGFVAINRIAIAEALRPVPPLFKSLAHHFLFEALMRANWKKDWATNATAPTQLERGQFLMGIHEMATTLGSTPRSIRTLLNHLTTLLSIEQKSTNKGSIITICNFDTFCPLRDEIDKQATSKRQASDNSKQEDKEKKKTKTSAIDAQFKEKVDEYMDLIAPEKQLTGQDYSQVNRWKTVYAEKMSNGTGTPKDKYPEAEAYILAGMEKIASSGFLPDKPMAYIGKTLSNIWIERQQEESETSDLFKKMGLLKDEPPTESS